MFLLQGNKEHFHFDLFKDGRKLNKQAKLKRNWVKFYIILIIN